MVTYRKICMKLTNNSHSESFLLFSASAHCNNTTVPHPTFTRMAPTFNLAAFLENNCDYLNIHGVAIGLFTDDTIYINTVFPGYTHLNKFISLELCDEYVSSEAFNKLFSINSRRDLDKITPHALLKLYEQGKMKIYCFIEEIHFGGTLYFSKTEGHTFAEDDEGAGRHEILKELLDADNYINYTNHYFLVNNHPSPREITTSLN